MPRLAQLRFSMLFVCGAFLCASPNRAQQPAEAPNIHVEVERVNVGVTVTDARGQFVSGLRREDFRLFDNGAEQPVTDFLSIEEPAQVLLLVEAGPAVYLLQEGHLAAVKVLLEGLAPADRVAIVRYDQSPETILTFMPDKRVAAGALDQLRFNVGFGQLNLASSLSTVLDWLARIPGKRSLVLLSTGVDTSPSESIRNLLARLQTTDVHVLPVSLTGNLRDVNSAPQKKGAKKNQVLDAKMQFAAEGIAQANDELNSIAAANGSHAFFPQTSAEFTQVFAQISQLIRHEYSLGFPPPAHDGKVHTLEVRLATESRAAFSVAPAATSAGSPSAAATATSQPSVLPRLDYRKAYLAPVQRTN